MVKVRVELSAGFGPRKGQVFSGVVVEADHCQLLKVMQNKLQINKKELKNLVLCCHDVRGLRVLPEGDLSDLLRNDVQVVACLGEPTEHLHSIKPSKKAQKALDALVLVNVHRGAIGARGRPNLEQLFSLQQHHGVTGVVTLLRENEGAAQIGQACQELGLKWWSAPLTGPKHMGLIGNTKPCLTSEDIESFKQICELRENLKTGGDRLVVHCAAGLHRTGIFLYVLFRELGSSPKQALETIAQMRQATFDEFVRLRFEAKAEAIFSVVGSRAETSCQKTIGMASDFVEVVSRLSGMEESEIEEPEERDEDDEGENEHRQGHYVQK